MLFFPTHEMNNAATLFLPWLLEDAQLYYEVMGIVHQIVQTAFI